MRGPRQTRDSLSRLLRYSPMCTVKGGSLGYAQICWMERCLDAERCPGRSARLRRCRRTTDLWCRRCWSTTSRPQAVVTGPDVDGHLVRCGESLQSSGLSAAIRMMSTLSQTERGPRVPGCCHSACCSIQRRMDLGHAGSRREWELRLGAGACDPKVDFAFERPGEAVQERQGMDRRDSQSAGSGLESWRRTS